MANPQAKTYLYKKPNFPVYISVSIAGKTGDKVYVETL